MSESFAPPHPLFTTSVEHWNGLARVVLVGELDLSSETALRRAFAAGESHARDAMIVDVHGVSFMDSTGLAVLLTAMQRAKEANRSFALRGARGVVQKLLAISGLHRMLQETAGLIDVDGPPADGWEPVPIPDGAVDV